MLDHVSQSVADCLEQHRQHGLFIFLAHAYLICRKYNHPLPEELLHRLDDHFTRLVDATTSAEGLAALSFGSNRKGGAWQGIAAHDILGQANKANLIRDLMIHGESNKTAAFKQVAEWTGASWRSVKQLFYSGSRRR